MSRILAVIPARAGSKGIPNKNIRLIAGKPMVWYAIKNAVDSEMITDIVVTTDSKEVATVAGQLGVNIRMRDPALCTDDVTLDDVILDAAKEGEWDYVVTMQPTSPTLKTETLDKAVRYAVENDLDTLISVINSPHLSWVVKDGKKVPDYKERLNRQYMPPRYMETGAFLISKGSIIKEGTRIGEKVDVYEVPHTEALDIDTFEDLRNASSLLRNQKIAIYVNGNKTRGMGHVYRALEIADEFFVKPDIYYDQNQTDPKVFGSTTHKLIPVNGIADLFARCKAEQYSIFINDILGTTIDYMIALRTVLPKAKIVISKTMVKEF